MGNQKTVLKSGKLSGGSYKARLIHEALECGSPYSAGEMWSWERLSELHDHLSSLLTKKCNRMLSGKN